MIRVNVTELRNNLPFYLQKVKTGEEVAVTSRGKTVARLVPDIDNCIAARHRLEAIRRECRVGDVVSPIDEMWEATNDTA